jgi:hypothetical protein
MGQAGQASLMRARGKLEELADRLTALLNG